MNLEQRLIKCYQLDNTTCNQAFIDYIAQRGSNNDNSQPHSGNLTTDQYYRISDIDHNQQPYSGFFTWFRHTLASYVDTLVDGDVSPFNYQFAALWAAHYTDADSAKPHVHGASCISWVYYLQVDDSAADLVFETFDLRVKPRTGLLVMFPGWVRHGVAVGGPRTILAGNVIVS